MSDQPQREEGWPYYDPLRCPCCNASLTDETPKANEAVPHVHKWFRRTMATILVGCGMLCVSVIVDWAWDIQRLSDSVTWFALGLLIAGVVPLRDHWKARRPA